MGLRFALRNFGCAGFGETRVQCGADGDPIMSRGHDGVKPSNESGGHTSYSCPVGRSAYHGSAPTLRCGLSLSDSAMYCGRAVKIGRGQRCDCPLLSLRSDTRRVVLRARPIISPRPLGGRGGLFEIGSNPKRRAPLRPRACDTHPNNDLPR